jgi:hypothetical protein
MNKATDLCELRNNILQELSRLDTVIQKQFPNEYERWYQHVYPQIFTALFDTHKWLPRGSVNLQNIIDHINDNDNLKSGVYKYIGDKNE